MNFSEEKILRVQENFTKVMKENIEEKYICNSPRMFLNFDELFKCEKLAYQIIAHHIGIILQKISVCYFYILTCSKSAKGTVLQSTKISN